tara:strand:+ start:977 stop:1237 length:261 start_codon:yes stop_codon:yes gene_type:complete
MPINIKLEKHEVDHTILMGNMKPLQVGVIEDSCYRDHVVMRTQAINVIEIIDLSDFVADNGFGGGHHHLKVRLLGQGESVTLNITN